MEAERPAHATLQELTRLQVGVKGKALQQEQGIGAFASKSQPQPFEGQNDQCGKKIFAVGLYDFLVVA